MKAIDVWVVYNRSHLTHSLLIEALLFDQLFLKYALQLFKSRGPQREDIIVSVERSFIVCYVDRILLSRNE